MTVTGVLALTLPALRRPGDGKVVTLEFSLQVELEVTVGAEPSLKLAVAVNWPLEFSLMVAGPLMDRPVRDAPVKLTIVTAFDAVLVMPFWV